MKSSTKQDVGIQYLRGVSALYVVFFHFREFLDNFLPIAMLGQKFFSNGAFGVDMFFIISGYIISLSTEKKDNSIVKGYIIKRFFRIYPAYFIALSILIILSPIKYSHHDILRSFMMIHPDYQYNAPYFGYGVLFTAWTLTYEIYFYIIFLIGMFFSHKHRIIFTSTIAIFAMISIQLIFNKSINIFHQEQIKNGAGILNVPGNIMVIDFIYGMFIYKIRNHLKLNKYSIAISFLLISIGFITIQSGVNAGHGPLQYGLYSLMIVLGVVMYEKNNKITEIKPLVFLGDISYSVYLYHVIIATCAYSLLLKIGFSGLSMFSMMTVLSIFLAYISYVLIEVPSVKVGHLMLKKQTKG
ncbi:hypothetical protein A191_00362 [Escherichia coli KTE233]|uniref:acyltransferase family protein n=1 Tax=Escherichia coli TaxID=562 RepID=UPI0002A4579A|nr:acyltransferase [Escherichia coli]HDR9824897.1 acyltransferase [Escherichia coli C186-61 (10h)]EFN4977296.1 acyltransferase [Escherichia coli]EGI4403875.1 acyltransferase [Escherichia coli]EIW2757639.1 acyltransferase [Escherichia coli]ELD0639966.1 acyltransferase [Escherichia coli]